jgi:hypothetical protein
LVQISRIAKTVAPELTSHPELNTGQVIASELPTNSGGYFENAVTIPFAHQCAAFIGQVVNAWSA